MKPERHDRAEAIARRIVERLDGKIVLGLPLGLGKANHVANALYALARADRGIELHISTALTLEPPRGSSELESRFIDPLRERLFSGVTELGYAQDLRSGELPRNVTVSEFFFLAGRWLSVPAAQQAYVSANYTHAAGYMAERGINVIAQMVAKRGEGVDARYSLSSNSDITLDILPLVKAAGEDCLLVGEVNDNLPFMTGPAALPASDFDMVLDGEGRSARLFATPKQPVSDADHAIGLRAAALVPDGGTLQIGIGSIGEAFTAALVLRHRKSALFADGLKRLNGGNVTGKAHAGPFEQGLYAASEMFVDGFMELYREDILKRRASDGAVLHGGFFLGTEEFYQFLRELPEGERDLFRMCGISFVNELYGEEETKRKDRVEARFVNNAMMATMLGETISDGLDDGRIVSGVGGQYNFVAQAFALEGARSVMTLNATRSSGGKTVVAHPAQLWAHHDPASSARCLRDGIWRGGSARQKRPRLHRRNDRHQRQPLPGGVGARGQGCGQAGTGLRGAGPSAGEHARKRGCGAGTTQGCGPLCDLSLRLLLHGGGKGAAAGSGAFERADVKPVGHGSGGAGRAHFRRTARGGPSAHPADGPGEA
jgi:acyl-CoA hydrolase